APHHAGSGAICGRSDDADATARLCRNSALTGTAPALTASAQRMPDLSRILTARKPLTLASVARGAQPLVLADLARAAHARSKGGRAIFIAPDEAAMRAVADAAGYFAPELEVIEFPAWDCLPYDRASPAHSVSARRLSALYRLQAGDAGTQ